MSSKQARGDEFNYSVPYGLPNKNKKTTYTSPKKDLKEINAFRKRMGLPLIVEEKR